MHKRIQHWLIGAALAAAVLYGLAFGHSQPTTVYGADPTPTPTQSPQGGEPGGSGGHGH